LLILMSPRSGKSAVQAALAIVFACLAILFLLDLWGRPSPLPPIPPVEEQFTVKSTIRTSLAELIRRGEDTSDFDCYGCHERGDPPKLTFDEDQNLLIPAIHSNIIMAHGRHNRNNLCFNCHEEDNLEFLQTRDGRELKLADSTALCGSCHGPTYRDWEAGAHGRSSGYWNRDMGPFERKECVACHDPHSPGFPPQQTAPGPHTLRPAKPSAAEARRH
jgi:hypothetical protein